MFRLSHFVAPAALGAALFIGGCAAERHDDIPLSAAEVDEGRESVTYTAPWDGRVYVYDKNSGDMLYNGELRRGQTVQVDAKDNKILVDNQTAVERDLVNDHRFKIFFDRDENADLARQQVPPSQTTIVTPPPQQTTIQTAPQQPAQPQTTIQVAPQQPVQPAQPRTTVETSPGAKTTVTTPDAKVTTDPESGRTTVQPR